MAAGADPCSSPSPQTAALRHRPARWAPGAVAVLLRPRRALAGAARASRQPAPVSCRYKRWEPGRNSRGLLRIQGNHSGCQGKDSAGDAVTSRWTVSFRLSRSKGP